jgi:hypothetical protein
MSKYKTAIVYPVLVICVATFVIWITIQAVDVLETKANAKEVYLSKVDAKDIYAKKSETVTEQSLTENEIFHLKEDIFDVKANQKQMFDLLIAMDQKMDKHFYKQVNVGVKCDVVPAVYGYSRD